MQKTERRGRTLANENQAEETEEDGTVNSDSFPSAGSRRSNIDTLTLTIRKQTAPARETSEVTAHKGIGCLSASERDTAAPIRDSETGRLGKLADCDRGIFVSLSVISAVLCTVQEPRRWEKLANEERDNAILPVEPAAEKCTCHSFRR